MNHDKNDPDFIAKVNVQKFFFRQIGEEAAAEYAVHLQAAIDGLTENNRGFAKAYREILDRIEMPFSKLVSENRSRLKMSQADLAKAAGVSRNYISMIERGHIENVSFGIIQKICKTLSLTIQITVAEPSVLQS